ncbi:MAG: transglutaminase domain-containing protein [Acidobacteria bacterium]|nr:transglutaminase domain-containing protein [Acidobacteriota bacterium]
MTQTFRWTSACLGLAGLVVALATGPAARAASIPEHRLEITLSGDEYLVEEHLVVRIASEGDVATWSRIPVHLMEGDELVESLAEVVGADGRGVRKVARREFEKVESPGQVLHSSDKAFLVPFHGLAVGEQIRWRCKTRRRPLFPATEVPLSHAAVQDNLRVRVSGVPFRWHLRGGGDALRVAASPEEGGALEIVGEGVPDLDLPPWSPPASSAAPALLLTWGREVDWDGVGTWYRKLIGGLPAAGPEVAAKARELVAGNEDPRQRLEALVDFVKSKVRYEAVEIGVGGWVPSPSGEVLGRGWGDCKDKSELLVQLMAEAGIPGHLALLRAGFGQRIEPGFPSPFQFNHAIVAVPASAVASSEGDPVGGDYLFIDPTSERGGVRWLTPASQGRHALVVGAEASRLVMTPERPADEGRSLRVVGTIDEAGDLVGRVEYRLQGSRALAWIRDLRERSLDRTLEDLQDVVHFVAPGGEVMKAGYKELDSAVPSLGLVAEIRVGAAVRGEAGRRWLRLGSLGSLPGSRELEDRDGVPVALSPGFSRTEWRLTLPAGWCPPRPEDEEAANALGRVTSRAAPAEGGTLVVERETRVDQSWVEEDSLPALTDLAVAENRFAKRRVRLECPEPAVSGSGI